MTQLSNMGTPEQQRNEWLQLSHRLTQVSHRLRRVIEGHATAATEKAALLAELDVLEARIAHLAPGLYLDTITQYATYCKTKHEKASPNPDNDAART